MHPVYTRCGRWGLSASQLFRVAQWACVGIAYFHFRRRATGKHQPFLNLVFLSSDRIDTFLRECQLPPVDEFHQSEYLVFQPHRDPASPAATTMELIWDCVFRMPVPKEDYRHDDLHQIRMLALLGVASRLSLTDVVHLTPFSVPLSVVKFNEACVISLPPIQEGNRTFDSVNVEYLVRLRAER